MYFLETHDDIDSSASYAIKGYMQLTNVRIQITSIQLNYSARKHNYIFYWCFEIVKFINEMKCTDFSNKIFWILADILAQIVLKENDKETIHTHMMVSGDESKWCIRLHLSDRFSIATWMFAFVMVQ